MLIDIYKKIKKQIEEGNFEMPSVLEFHPVLNKCNLKCDWCIGKASEECTSYYMKYEEIEPFIQSAFSDDNKSHWPSEIHFCGNNSEPLLNSKFINQMCSFINNKSVIEIITNGILIDKVKDSLLYIDKISISLDVFCCDEFIEKKKGSKKQYEKIWDNIYLISELKKSRAIKTMLYITFVLDKVPENIETVNALMEKLRKYGVNYIQFRSNYLNLDRKNIAIKKFVEELYERFSDKEEIDYTSEKQDIFYIKFNEYDYTNLNPICYMKSIWPIITADGWVFPCAHVANHKYMDLATKIDFNENYLNFWKMHFHNITCKRQNICPSMAYAINSICGEQALS